ncbi:MAG: hypothetical protein LBS60_09710 [Deltaproteobacteria bacterium]|jgi:hypothetical protein|nr:hypothetical protein [Deltaproteobacteria bacterium]
METLKEISIDTNAGYDFKLLLGNFLDAFYYASQIVRQEMINEEPNDMERVEYIPLLAATANKLANDYGLKTPSWAFAKRCYLPGNKPYFGNYATGKLRLIYMYESPLEFKHRNLFVDNQAISRV